MRPKTATCPFGFGKSEPIALPPASDQHATYTMTGGPKGLPGLGMLIQAKRNPLEMLKENSLRYGDVIPFHVAGSKMVQINHPELVQYVLTENHKNYYKSVAYIRFESALGQGLLTSNGEKWRRDRQKMQPMFKREQMEGYYFEIFNEVSEKYKKRWLLLTEKGPAEINISHEMADITIEIILKTIFGRHNMDEATIISLHRSYDILIDYLKELRLIPTVDFRKIFRAPSYNRFKKELDNVEKILQDLLAQYREGLLSDKYNMLALLIEAQKEDPEHFTETTIRDQSVSMVFAGFETTSVVMQWIWYVLDGKNDIVQKLREEIAAHAGNGELSYEAVNGMDYLSAVFKETMRLYPPLWATGRSPIAEDRFGNYKVDPGNIIILPQIVLHRHPRWWNEPDTFIPERFLPGNEESIDPGLFFPFSQGPRKCSGFKFAEMETKTLFAKLLPLFDVKILNAANNGLNSGGITLKPCSSLRALISRL